VDSILVLLEANASVNLCDYKNGATPLIVATIKGHYAVVELLVNRGADIELRDRKNGDTALLKAAEINNLRIVNILALKGASLDVINKVSSFCNLLSYRRPIHTHSILCAHS
jgi:ankyrin repeat protein